MIHRGDLQAALLGAALAHHDITLTLGAAVDDCAAHANGVTVQVLRGQSVEEIHAGALIGADGLWSRVRALAGEPDAARFARRTAWRALVLADAVPPEFRAPAIHLWLGHGTHLVHYPVKAGAMINIVAIAGDARPSIGWSTAAAPDEVMARFAAAAGARPARDLRALPERWLKWPLYDRPPRPHRGRGAVTLLWDAAHPMLPFLAQGAGLAIEDAAVLADMLRKYRDDPADALRAYEGARRVRTERAQRASRGQGRIYGRSGPEALIRNFGMRMVGGEKLLRRYDWLYTWQPPEFFRT